MERVPQMLYTFMFAKQLDGYKIPYTKTNSMKNWKSVLKYIKGTECKKKYFMWMSKFAEIEGERYDGTGRFFVVSFYDVMFIYYKLRSKVGI